MVIIRTSATDVIIQAVSPALGVHFSSTANFGSALPAQAGGAASAAAAGAAASSAEVRSIADMLRKRAKRTPNARAKSPARVGFLNVMDLNSCRWTLECGGLQCGGVGLAGADAHGGIEGEDKNLSVPDLAGLGGRGDGIDRFLDLVGRYRHFDLDLRQEAHGIFSAAINLRVALLTPVSLDLRHGHSVHADRSQSVADLVELERLDDGHDDFHGLPPLAPPPCGCRLRAVFVERRRAKHRRTRQCHPYESSPVPVRRSCSKCMETNVICTKAGGGP